MLYATPRQTCPRPRSRAQIAFKDSMIHGILQFTLSIAFRYVLHRNERRYPLPRVICFLFYVTPWRPPPLGKGPARHTTISLMHKAPRQK